MYYPQIRVHVHVHVIHISVAKCQVAWNNNNSGLFAFNFHRICFYITKHYAHITFAHNSRT